MDEVSLDHVIPSSPVADTCQSPTKPLDAPLASDITLQPFLPPSPKCQGGRRKALGHQGAKSGGKFVKDVVYCTKANSSLTYDNVYDEMNQFGTVRRIKMIYDKSDDSYEIYVTFLNSVNAEAALDHMKSKDTENAKNYLIKDSRNLADDPFDFIPPATKTNETARKPPTLTWHVGIYKGDNSNFIKASEFIQKKIGNLPPGHLKKYGRGILIRAGNDTQIHMLENFHPSEEGYIRSITPHKSFNTVKGVVYSKDLYEYDEEEILTMCPPLVYAVKKLKGTNNAIVLTFSSHILPTDLLIEHSRIKVRKFKQRPTQCFQCFTYGHIISKCTNTPRCRTCSGTHDTTNDCSLPAFCLHCNGPHSPSSRSCPKYKLETKILEVAHDEKVSYGTARNIVGEPDRTFKSTLLKAVPAKSAQNTQQSATSKSSSSKFTTAATTSIDTNTLVKLNEARKPQHPGNSHEIAQHSNSTPAASENNAPQHTVQTKDQIQTCIKTPEESSVIPSTSKGFGKIRATPDIDIYNKYAALASLEDDDNNSVPEKDDKITDASQLEKKTGGKRRGQGNGTTPKPKKPNTTNEHIHPYLDNKDLMEVQINGNETQKAPQPLLQHESDITQFDPEHQAVEAKVKEPSMNNKSYIEVLTPSPIIGKTGKSLIHPKARSTEIESPPQTTSVITDSSLNLVDTNKSHTLPHKPSCGCHQCFVDKLADIKEISPKSCSILIDNFIKYKAKNQYGDLEEHTKDCMCVDHLMKIRTSDSLAIPNLLEKIKQKQGSIPKRLTNKLNTKNPIVQQKFVSTKVSRHNVLLDRTQSTK